MADEHRKAVKSGGFHSFFRGKNGAAFFCRRQGECGTNPCHSIRWSTMGAGLLSQFVFMAITAANHTTGLRPWKCTPSVAYGDVSPRESVSHDSQSPTAPYESCSLATPEGEILAALYLELLMNSNAERRENFPLWGKWCVAPKGVHFHALCTFCRECASQSKLAHSLPIKGPSF